MFLFGEFSESCFFISLFYPAREPNAADLAKTKPERPGQTHGHATKQLHALLQAAARQCFRAFPSAAVFILKEAL